MTGHKLVISNTAIATADGLYSVKTISLSEVKMLIKDNAGNLDSAIGHESTAQILSGILGIKIDMHRKTFSQQPSQEVLVFKLKGRAPEGKILSESEINEIGYEFKLMTRIE